MSRKILSAGAARQMILSEAARLGLIDDHQHDCLAIIGNGSSWCATLRPGRERIDEARYAAVSEIGRRLAAEYSLS